MGILYNNNDSDYLNANTYALFAGNRVLFRLNPIFSVSVDVWGGYQTNNLVDDYLNSAAPTKHINAATLNQQTITGTLDQLSMTYSLGVQARLSEHMLLVPYMGYTTTASYPDAVTKANQGSIVSLSNSTNTSQYYPARRKT